MPTIRLGEESDEEEFLQPQVESGIMIVSHTPNNYVNSGVRVKREQQYRHVGVQA